MNTPHTEKYTWKIVAGVYIPGTETLEEHCERMGYNDSLRKDDKVAASEKPQKYAGLDISV